MSDRERNFVLICVVALAGLGGGLIGRALAPAGHQATSAEARRPIIQFVRQQPGLPTLADAVAALCPSIVGIEPAAVTTAGAQSAAIPGFAVSADGWVMAATASLPDGQLQAVFGPANAAAVSEVRSDPVSGLSILKTNATGLRPVPWSDQAFPRVGDFGFAIQNPQGAGCSAEAAMVASDFLTDGGAPAAYVRLDPMGADIIAGVPFISGTGQAVGMAATAGPPNSIIPASVLADIEDELMRDSLSPTTEFGFRAADFPPTIAARLSDSRAIGTGIALVQPKSAAAHAGLRAGDIVVQVNGSPVASASELGRALDAAGKSASMDLVRGDQRLSVSLARTAGS